MKIAVIRFNALDNFHVVDAISSMNYTLLDIFHKDHIQVETINNEGILEVFFKGISIKDFDRILYFSMPDDKDFYLKSNDEKYASTELFTTVIAALKIRENVLINGYDAFNFNQLLQKPLAQIVNLNKLGWHVPSISSRYDLKEKKIVSFREPEPNLYFKYYFIATQKHFFIYPQKDVNFPNQQLLTELFEKVKSFLFENKMEWVVIPFIIHEGEYYAYGLTNKIPYHLDVDVLNLLIKNILS